MTVLDNLVPSIIRTAVPGLVGWLLTLPLAAPLLDTLGVTSQAASTYLTALLGFLFGLAYYLLVRAVEHFVPAAGALLGYPAKPVYGVTDLAAVSAELVQSAAPAPATVIHVHADPGVTATAASAVKTAATSAPSGAPSLLASLVGELESASQQGLPSPAGSDQALADATPVATEAQAAAAG